MSVEPHLDFDHVESLLDFLAADKVRALFESALRGAGPLLNEMRESAAAGDANKLYRAGHSAKGMFGNLGMRRCEDLSRSIERLAKAGDIAAAAALFPELETDLAATAAVMMQWLEQKTENKNP